MDLFLRDSAFETLIYRKWYPIVFYQSLAYDDALTDALAAVLASPTAADFFQRSYQGSLVSFCIDLSLANFSQTDWLSESALPATSQNGGRSLCEDHTKSYSICCLD